MDITQITDQGEIAVLIVREERVLQRAQENLNLLNARFDQLEPKQDKHES